ncbi:hypothetical protein LTR28_011583, partial [Elasticomyces elasticus]
MIAETPPERATAADDSAKGSFGQSLSGEAGPSKRRRVDEDEASLGQTTGVSRRTSHEKYDGAPRVLHELSPPDAQTSQDLQRWKKLQSLEYSIWGFYDPEQTQRHPDHYKFLARIDELIEEQKAPEMFDRYITGFAPHLPAVVFPSGTTASGIRESKPVLYAAVLSVAAFGSVPPQVQRELSRETMGALADTVMRNGAKSLELIQAMQVCTLWYKPPEQSQQTNFYQLIHMAAVMALDIGLGKRFNAVKARKGFDNMYAKKLGADAAPGPGRQLLQDSDTVEARRAWLGCYYLCASASMVLRRPSLVRWTNYMTECIEVLESSPEAAPSDRLLCQHVKIQQICEEIGLQFLMDDPTASISISDPKVT